VKLEEHFARPAELVELANPARPVVKTPELKFLRALAMLATRSQLLIRQLHPRLDLSRV